MFIALGVCGNAQAFWGSKVMGLHRMVEKVVMAYLDAVDSEAPGLIEGLYLTGSTALDEFRPNTSDIDFVAITAARPEAAKLAGLARTHSRLRRFCRRPSFDGLYVTWDDLASHPAHAEGLPSTKRRAMVEFVKSLVTASARLRDRREQNPEAR